MVPPDASGMLCACAQDYQDTQTLHFIVSCLEELRAEDAAAAAAAVSGSPVLSDAVSGAQLRAAAAGPAAVSGAHAAGVQGTDAQQDDRPSQADGTVGTSFAPHKQAPFSGTKIIPCASVAR